MADSFEITVFGTRLASRHLRAIGDRAADIEPALRSIAGDLREITAEAFGSRGLRTGTAWPTLFENTIARKARDKDDKVAANASKVLHATERLRESLTDKFDKDHIENVDDNTLEFGSRVPYGIYLQTGTKDMKARPPVRLREHQRKRAVRKVERWITTGILT